MMSMLKCCLNPKVLVGLGVVAIAILVFQPSLLSSALPTLLLLICPLSMGAMLFAMGKKDTSAMADQGTQQGQQYTCPMHPEVRSDQPGRCPKCGMALVPVKPARPAQQLLADRAGAALNREEQVRLLRAELQSLGKEQATLARQIEQLQADEAIEPARVALRDAEHVARGTNHLG